MRSRSGRGYTNRRGVHLRSLPSIPQPPHKGGESLAQSSRCLEHPHWDRLSMLHPSQLEGKRRKASSGLEVAGGIQVGIWTSVSLLWQWSRSMAKMLFIGCCGVCEKPCLYCSLCPFLGFLKEYWPLFDGISIDNARTALVSVFFFKGSCCHWISRNLTWRSSGVPY